MIEDEAETPEAAVPDQPARPARDHTPGGHGPMGHSGAGHLLHMAPILLILLAPRLGWPLTIGLLALLGGYVYVSWRRRRAAQTSSEIAPVPRRDE